MTWAAMDRYGVEPAPGGLAFVQDMLNTFSAGKPRKADWFEDVDAARQWLDGAMAAWSEATGRQVESVELSDRDIEELHAFRRSLRRLISNPPGAALEAGRDSLVLPKLATTVRLNEDGEIRTEPAGTGWRRVASLAMIECSEAQRTGIWRRLKICRSERCETAFYDRSKNNSGVWHNVHVCGNAANLRAYRARKRAQTTAGAEEQ